MSLYSKTLNVFERDYLGFAATKSFGDVVYSQALVGAGIGALGGAGIGANSTSSDWSSGGFYGGVTGAALGGLGGLATKNISNNFVRGSYSFFDEGIEKFSNAKAVKRGKSLRSGFWSGVNEQFLI